MARAKRRVVAVQLEMSVPPRRCWRYMVRRRRHARRGRPTMEPSSGPDLSVQALEHARYAGFRRWSSAKPQPLALAPLVVLHRARPRRHRTPRPARSAAPGNHCVLVHRRPGLVTVPAFQSMWSYADATSSATTGDTRTPTRRRTHVGRIHGPAGRAIHTPGCSGGLVFGRPDFARSHGGADDFEVPAGR